MRYALSLALALCLLPVTAPALAQTASVSPEDYEQTIIELRLNDQAQTQTVVAWRGPDQSLLISAGEFARLRLREPATATVEIGGQRYFRFDAIPGIAIDVDDKTQSAAVIAPADAFLPTHTQLDALRYSRVDAVGYGGFFNYDLSATSQQGEVDTGVFMEPGIYSPQGVLTSTLAARSNSGHTGLTRLDTVFVRDMPDRIQTLRVGDAISAPGSWGQSVRFGGIQFGTNFATQPGLVTTPLLGTSGEALVPSTVDVFLNGQRIAQADVPPGPFTLDGVPAISGAGEMQVVITDALGRQQIVSQPYYSGRQMLRAGLDEYSFGIGAIREDFGLRSNAYGGLVGSATWRRGFSDRLTAEVHGEGQADGAAAVGVDLAVQVAKAGILTTTLASGGESLGDGWLAGMGFERSGRRFSGYLRNLFTSEHFARIGSERLQYRPRSRSFGGLGLNLGKSGSLQLAAGYESYWNEPDSKSLGLSYSILPGTLGSLSLSVTHRQNGSGQGIDAYLSWTRSLGQRRTGNVTTGYGPSGDGRAFSVGATLQKSLPVGTGTGYLLSAASDGDALLGYSLQGQPGTVHVEYARRDDRDGVRAGAIGGLAFTPAGLFASRRLDRSFAVLEFDGYPGLTVLHENQPIGRTDKKGRLLIDGLRAYEANKISLRPREIPLDASLQNESMTFTPAWRSGAVVRFPIQRANAATLRLVLPDGSPVPAGAEVIFGEARFPVALDGMIYVTGLSADVEVEASWRDHVCRARLSRPAGREPVPDLGTVTCTAVNLTP